MPSRPLTRCAYLRARLLCPTLTLTEGAFTPGACPPMTPLSWSLSLCLVVWDNSRGMWLAHWASTCWLKKKKIPLNWLLPAGKHLFLAALGSFDVLLSGYPCGCMTMSDPPCFLICKHICVLQRASSFFFFLLL